MIRTEITGFEIAPFKVGNDVHATIFQKYEKVNEASPQKELSEALEKSFVEIHGKPSSSRELKNITYQLDTSKIICIAIIKG